MRYLGMTDDVTTCECCGRANLKSTVAIELTDGSAPVYFGITCAAKALKTGVKEVRAGVKAAEREREAKDRAKQAARFAAEYAADQVVLDAWYPALRGNRFAQVQALYENGKSLSDVARNRQ